MSKMKEVKSNKDSSACPLKKHTAKSRLAAFVLGIFIGLAVIVPGVSGSTVAIMFGLYASLLYAIGNILGDFKRCFAFLLPIGLGAVIGFVGGFLVIQKLFGEHMFLVICLFAGLMIGALPALTVEIKWQRPTALRASLLGVGVIIPLAVGALSILLSSGAAIGSESFTDFPFYLFLLYIPLGMVVSATQIIPGLSATAILMACGQFRPILNSLHREYIFENPQVLGLYICIGGGFLVGIILISRAFSKILEAHRLSTFFLVVGLSLGSVLSMFLNPDIWEIYSSWAGGEPFWADIAIGAVLLLLGAAASFALARYEMKKVEN